MSSHPIFVHSLFRSGSTYLFGVFRRSTAGYWCYQEPLNEYLRHVADAPERLLEIGSRDGSLLRHPALDKPYFLEFYQVRDAIAPLFRKEFSYDAFFMAKDHPAFQDLRSYLQTLIDNAKGRPFFQCCRTTGRFAALRDTFGGTHLHLWRNPHDQWWSYQVGDYFDATTRLIYGAPDLPAALVAARDFCGIAAFHNNDVEKELAYGRNHRLSAREGYVSFYALWLYSMLACEKAADLSVNIDALSTSDAYRQRILRALARDGIDGLDLSDCAIAQAPFDARDIAFFAEAEERVHEIFQNHGLECDDLAAVLESRARHRPASRVTTAVATAASFRVRDLAVRQMDTLAQTQRDLVRRQIDLEAATTLTVAQREQIAGAQVALKARDADLARALSRSSGLASELADTRLQVAAMSAELVELADARVQIAAMSSELVEGGARLDQGEVELASARQRLERLHDELRAAGVRLEEAHLETNRWWTLADDTGRHLQAIYASRSWRLTAPLREINAWRKQLAGSTEVGVAVLDSMPRRAIQRLLLAAWEHARGRPERRARFVWLLAPFPRLYARLRAFAFAHAPVKAGSAPPAQSHVEMPGLLETENGTRWNGYPKSVQQIHSQLMRARATTAHSMIRTPPTQT